MDHLLFQFYFVVGRAETKCICALSIIKQQWLRHFFIFLYYFNFCSMLLYRNKCKLFLLWYMDIICNKIFAIVITYQNTISLYWRYTLNCWTFITCTLSDNIYWIYILHKLYVLKKHNFVLMNANLNNIKNYF